MNTDTNFKNDTATTAPAALPEALRKRLLAAMQQAADEEYGCREVEQMLRRFRPAPVPPRLLAAMQQAADVERGRCEVTQLLSQFRPAPLSSRLEGRVGVAMMLETTGKTRTTGKTWMTAVPAARMQMRTTEKDKSISRYLTRGGLAAAIVASLVAGGMMLGTGSAVAENENQSLVSRNVIESRSSDHVEWRRGDAPVRHYTVVYEDAFVMDAEETTTVIRVPNTSKVEVEEDYL